jgi:hypothetical protein
MPSAGFESAIPATKRPQTYALDRAATGIVKWLYTSGKFAALPLLFSLISLKMRGMLVISPCCLSVSPNNPGRRLGMVEAMRVQILASMSPSVA